MGVFSLVPSPLSLRYIQDFYERDFTNATKGSNINMGKCLLLFIHLIYRCDIIYFKWDHIERFKVRPCVEN